MITNMWITGISEDAMFVRNEVFVKEQNVPKEIEFDVFDEQSINLIVYVDEKPAATGRIYHDGKTFRLGRMCVLKEHRGQNIGDLLLRLLIIKVFSFLPSVVKINAQKTAVGFYEKFGFKVTSESFMEADIEHVEMSIKSEEVTLTSKCGKEIKLGGFYE